MENYFSTKQSQPNNCTMDSKWPLHLWGMYLVMKGDMGFGGNMPSLKGGLSFGIKLQTK